MRIAVVGASGRIGRLTAEALERGGHEVVRLSRSNGVDVVTGAGLADALRDVEVVVDTFNDPTATTADAAVDAFGGEARTLLDAERTAGVKHHVLLSIVNVHENGAQVNAHYAGKTAQEKIVEGGDVPWTIVPATQFHDFPDMISSWSEQDGSATVPPLLLQPIAPGDIADVLAEIAVGSAQGRYRDVAGPRTEDAVDMARRTRAARGAPITLVPTWRGAFGLEASGEALIPHNEARLTPTTFDDWLATEYPTSRS